MTGKNTFLELKSTEGQVIFVRKTAVDAIEVAPSTTRVEGHIKIYAGGHKFLVQGEKDELLNKLSNE